MAKRGGAKLNLTWNERQKLSIRTISAVGLTPEESAERRKERRREKARDRKARQRRKAGAKSRIAYRSTALAHLKPWERQGISRATRYRRRETVRETSASRNKLLDSSVTNLSQVSVERERNSRKREWQGRKEEKEGSTSFALMHACLDQRD